MPVIPIPNGAAHVAINLELQGYIDGSDEDVDSANYTHCSKLSKVILKKSIKNTINMKNYIQYQCFFIYLCLKKNLC